MTAAQVVAANLAHLQHPDGILYKIPGFDPAMLNHPDYGMAAEAQKIGEAVVHTIEVNGFRVASRDEIRAEVQAEVAKLGADSKFVLRCRRCREPVAEIDTAQSAHNLGLLASGLSKHLEVCR